MGRLLLGACVVAVVLTIVIDGVGGGGGVEAEEVRDGVEVRPEVLGGQVPTALHGDEVGNDSSTTHLSSFGATFLKF